MNISNVLISFDYNYETGLLQRVLAGGVRVSVQTVCNGYLRSTVDGKPEYAHRIAWCHYYREQPPEFIDHINRDRSDNSIKNLRSCTLSQNQFNRNLSSNNSTGYTGVSIIKKTGKYKATIYKDSKPIHLGVFSTADLAAKAYKNAKAAYQLKDLTEVK